MYKRGGKKPKSSFMEESKEIKFGNGGLYSSAEVSANKKKVAEMNGKQDPAHQTQVKKKTGGVEMKKEGGRKARLEGRAERIMGRAQKNWKKGTDALEFDRENNPETSNAIGYANKKLNKAARQEERAEKVMAKAKELKKTGGMSKFQQMAAKGKKGMGGMSDSTSANDAGMEMMENTEAMGPKRPKKNKGYNYKNHSRKNKHAFKNRNFGGKGTCAKGQICLD